MNGFTTVVLVERTGSSRPGSVRVSGHAARPASVIGGWSLMAIPVALVLASIIAATAGAILIADPPPSASSTASSTPEPSER